MLEYPVSLWGLFTSAFLSSTLLPGSSEAVILMLASTTDIEHLDLLWVATAGNTLGAMSTWLIGYWLAVRHPDWVPVKPHHRKAVDRLHRWGWPALLLSWVPVIGDPLCLVAGWLRIHWLLSLVLILTGKAVRYFLLLQVV